MHIHIVNHNLSVGSIRMIGVSSSSLVQVGDTDWISLYSYFDSPPDSLVRLPLVPLAAPDPLDEESEAEAEDPGSFFWESMEEWETTHADMLEEMHEQFWAEALNNLKENEG